jgi:hypothetical protein
MRASAFETSVPAGPIGSLPVHLVQTPSRSLPWLMLALGLPAALSVMAPFVMIAAHAATDASGRALVLDRADTVAQLAVALVVWALMFGWPAGRIAARIGCRREIALMPGTVSVIERGPLRTRVWSAPLSSFLGLSHRVRATLSGTRHELVLVHRQGDRSLLLRTADRIGQAEVSALASLLGCREIAHDPVNKGAEDAVGAGLSVSMAVAA